MNTEEVKKQKAFELFVIWSAMPSAKRTPPTQGELAKVIGVDETTLGRWKKVEGYRALKNKAMLDWLNDEMPDIFYAALLHFVKDGDMKKFNALVGAGGGEGLEHIATLGNGQEGSPSAQTNIMAVFGDMPERMKQAIKIEQPEE